MKTFEKIVALAMSLILIVGIMALPVSAAGNAEITVSDASGNIGDEVTVTISFTSNPGVAGFQLTIAYDKSSLKLVKMDEGDFGGSFTGDASKSDTIVWYKTSNVTKTCEFATLKFKIIGNKTGTYEIGLDGSDSVINQEYKEVPTTIHKGKITVTCKHSYGSWEKDTAENHKHTCSVCNYVDHAAHT